MDERVITSYVVSKDKKGFQISTAERSCSSPYAPDLRYFETLVFEWNWELKTTGKLIHQVSGGIDQHILCALHLFNNGNLEILVNENLTKERE